MATDENAGAPIDVLRSAGPDVQLHGAARPTAPRGSSNCTARLVQVHRCHGRPSSATDENPGAPIVVLCSAGPDVQLHGTARPTARGGSCNCTGVPPCRSKPGTRAGAGTSRALTRRCGRNPPPAHSSSTRSTASSRPHRFDRCPPYDAAAAPRPQVHGVFRPTARRDRRDVVGAQPSLPAGPCRSPTSRDHCRSRRRRRGRVDRFDPITALQTPGGSRLSSTTGATTRFAFDARGYRAEREARAGRRRRTRSSSRVLPTARADDRSCREPPRSATTRARRRHPPAPRAASPDRRTPCIDDR